MAATDIKRFGTSDGKARSWIKQPSPWGPGRLRLAVIDEFGNVETTPAEAEWDEAAMIREEAIRAHLAAGIAEADRQLDKRRREAPKQPPKPPRMDPATRRFFSDGDEYDLS